MFTHLNQLLSSALLIRFEVTWLSLHLMNGQGKVTEGLPVCGHQEVTTRGQSHRCWCHENSWQCLKEHGLPTSHLLINEPWKDLEMSFAFLLRSVAISNPVTPLTDHLEMEADKLTTVPLAKHSAQQPKQAF